MTKGATFSECKQYRYLLYRIWNTKLPVLVCIGLNPSTANEEKNDQTINKLIRIVQNAGYGGFYMMNLFGLISRNPDDLRAHPDPVGANDKYLQHYTQGQTVVFCWGNFKQAEYRAKKIKQMFPGAKCFGTNANGSPKHPLFLKSTTQIIDYGTKENQT